MPPVNERMLWSVLEAESPLQVVGVVNAYAAKLADRAGFRALYLSGAGVANSCFGLPDIGVTNLYELCEEVRRIREATSTPLLVDADTGFGGIPSVERTVRSLESAGASAIHIEDQTMAKRCGHLPGKTLIDTTEMVDRIKAAVDARQQESFAIMARTDARSVAGLEEALHRAQKYVEAGADMIFAEALTTIEEVRAFATQIDVPILVNLTEFGKTPLLSLDEIRQSGVRLVLYPLSAFRAMSKAAADVYTTIRNEGTQRNLLDTMQSRSELYEVLGYRMQASNREEAQRSEDGAGLARSDAGKSLTPNTTPSQGLRGIAAGSTSICTVGEDCDTLRYCGYNVQELAASSTFEEVAFLLLHGRLPNCQELEEFTSRLVCQRKLPEPLKRMLEQIPIECHPMEMLRTACSYLGTIEPEQSFREQDAATERLLGVTPSIIGYWYRSAMHWTPLEIATDERSTAGYLLSMLSDREPTEDRRRFIDVSLMLYAEHEFNASTFTARVIAATLADLHSAIAGAIGSLRGPLHGGANEAAMQLIESFPNVAAAREGIQSRLANKSKIMGFGHAVYKSSDPRSAILKRWSERLAHDTYDRQLLEIAHAIEDVMRHEKSLFPNADFYCATAYHFSGIPTVLFTPLFAAARTAGWCAHIKEQRRDNKLIRPSAHYTGPPPRNYVDMAERNAQQSVI